MKKDKRAKSMPPERPKRLKPECCKKYKRKGRYCKRCPLYWGRVAKGAGGTGGSA